MQVEVDSVLDSVPCYIDVTRKSEQEKMQFKLEYYDISSGLQ